MDSAEAIATWPKHGGLTLGLAPKADSQHLFFVEQ